MVAVALIGSAIVGAGASIYGANKAAAAQTKAADKATETQLKMFDEAKTALQPFISGGTVGINKLIEALPGLTKPITMTQEELEATPGYKFTLAQGLKSAQNSAGARGLGSSGAAIKGAAEFATGLSDATYNTRFQQEIASRNQILQALVDAINPGVQSGAALAGQAVQTGSNVGSNIIGAGNAQAASSIATGNAIGQGVSNVLTAPYMAKSLYSPVTPTVNPNLAGSVAGGQLWAG